MEKNRYSGEEELERVPLSFEVSFDRGRFGNKQKPIATEELVGEMNRWWKQICAENGIDPNDEIVGAVHYYLMELGKNALEHAQGGCISVTFEPHKITVIVSDEGSGFRDQNDADYYSSPKFMGRGLSQVRAYADEFYIESWGRKHAKVRGSEELVEIGESKVIVGAKITFVKNF